MKSGRRGGGKIKGGNVGRFGMSFRDTEGNKEGRKCEGQWTKEGGREERKGGSDSEREGVTEGMRERERVRKMRRQEKRELERNGDCERQWIREREGERKGSEGMTVKECVNEKMMERVRNGRIEKEGVREEGRKEEIIK